MVSMPEDLSGSRELSALIISSSDMFIETKCCLTEESTLALLLVGMKLLVEKTQKKDLLNKMALLTSSVAVVSPKWTVLGIEVDFLMFHIYLYILECILHIHVICLSLHMWLTINNFAIIITTHTPKMITP